MPAVIIVGLPIPAPGNMKRPEFLNLISGRFGHGVFWNALGTLIAQGSTFFTAILLARMLGKEIFGELGMIHSTLLTLASIAQVSTGLTATKYIAEFRGIDKTRAGKVLGLCSVLTVATGIAATVLLLISAPWMAEHILKAPHLAVSLGISAAFVLFSVMNGYQIGALAGLECYRSISIYGALLGGLHLIICSVGALLGGLDGALLGIVVSAILRWAVYANVLRHEASKQDISLRRRGWAEERNILWGFTLPAALSGLTTLPAIWGGNALLVRQLDGYAEMGIYSAAMSLRMIVLFLPALLNGVAISLINNHKGNRDNHSLETMFVLNLKLTAVVAFFGATLLWLWGEPALKIFGSDFYGENIKLMLVLMSISVVVESIGIAVYQLIQSYEKMWASFFAIAIPRDILIVATAYFLTPIYGAAGLAGAMTIGALWAFFIKIGLVYKMKLYGRRYVS